MTADDVRRAFERWQSQTFLHPLTCHGPLTVRDTTAVSATLVCAQCGWVQDISEEGNWPELFQIARQIHEHPERLPWEFEK